MPYRQMTGQDIWVDDPGSPDYDGLKKRRQRRQHVPSRTWSCPTTATSTALLSNTTQTPSLPADGSAIFIHVWKDEKTATSGCVALSEENILKLIRWLDPAKKPVIMLGHP